MKSLLGSHSAVAALLLSFWTQVPAAGAPGSAWLSPSALVAAPDGAALYVVCATGERVLMVDLAARKVTKSMAVPGHLSGAALSADGKILFVTCAAPSSQICLVDTAGGQVIARLPGGHTAGAPVLSPDGKTLYVCNRFDNDVSVFDVATRKEVRRIPVRREPVAAAITPDGKRLLVANHLHAGRADAEHVAATVSVIDTAQGQVIDDLWLPDGSGLLNDLRISPDGNYAVVTHILARFRLPTTQLDRGWMNTNAKTIIALDRMRVVNTVLLDTVDRGAANPWGVAWSADGKNLVVAQAGTHDISVTDFPALLAKLARIEASAPAPAGTGWAAPTGWTPAAEVPNDLSTLVGIRQRYPLPVGDLGPRAVVVVGKTIYTANYFSDTLTAFSIDAPQASTLR